MTSPPVRTDPSCPAEMAPVTDLPSAQAMVDQLRALAGQQGLVLDQALRPPPPEPTTCCGRGCNGCVWEGFYAALDHWRLDALALLNQR